MFENTGDNGNLTSTDGFGFPCFLTETDGFGFSCFLTKTDGVGFPCFENIGAANNDMAGFFQSEKPLDDEIQSFEK